VQQDGKRRGGYTWWVLVAGEGAREGAAEDGTARPVIAAERLREETERERKTDVCRTRRRGGNRRGLERKD
jgi:hypothetical protein